MAYNISRKYLNLREDNTILKKSSILTELDELSKINFEDITYGLIGEESITQHILTKIVKLAKNGDNDIIKFDDSYKETGKNISKTKDGHIHRTCADYVLAVKNKKGEEHYFSFQAKIGKKKSLGNEYSEITHRIGNKGPFQIDEYINFIKENNSNSNYPNYINGYYIFYNGNFKNLPNSKYNSYLNEHSFWILKLDQVKKIMGTAPYEEISIADVVNSHTDFVGFLRRIV